MLHVFFGVAERVVEVVERAEEVAGFVGASVGSAVDAALALRELLGDAQDFPHGHGDAAGQGGGGDDQDQQQQAGDGQVAGRVGAERCQDAVEVCGRVGVADLGQRCFDPSVGVQVHRGDDDDGGHREATERVDASAEADPSQQREAR